MKQKMRLLSIVFLFIVSLCLFTSQVYAQLNSAPAVAENYQQSGYCECQCQYCLRSAFTGTESSQAKTPVKTELQVVVLDVGQADSILLLTDEHNMLIDAGNIGDDKLILDYLASYDVKNLDYLVATHPHADHIGTMAAVVRAMENIETVLMPDIIHTTKTFETLLNVIEEKDIPITIARPGDTFVLGNAQIQVLAPNNVKYSNLNDYSVVLRVKFGDTVFLFTGDADVKSENEQLANGLPLKADVLKVGHHGSRTSSAQKYLDAVTPKFAVISLGKDNLYSHPHIETMNRLNGMNLEIYRTDVNGTVTFVTDGKVITVKPEREIKVAMQPENTQQTLYIGSKKSKIFHKTDCRGLPQEQNRVNFATRDNAINENYSPCLLCNP
jgi:competence protein ComEC